MTHYKMMEKNPSVTIMVRNPKNRSLEESKIYENKKVFLKDKQEFVLRFFNPLQDTIGVDIKFNGKQTTNGYLVIKPGQMVDLERFINENRKMIFETYKIDGSSEQALKATENNGLLEFSFYKEYVYQQPPIYTYTTNYLNNDYTSPINNITFTTNNANNVSFNSAENLYKGDINSNKDFLDISNNSVSRSRKSVETGRIEKGQVSDQKLEGINIAFDYYPFYSTELKLIPDVYRNYETSEIRNYCSSCGYRIRKSTWTFCPKCGEKLS